MEEHGSKTFACNQHFTHATWNPTGEILSNVFNSTPNSHSSTSVTHFLLKNDMSDKLG